MVLKNTMVRFTMDWDGYHTMDGIRQKETWTFGFLYSSLWSRGGTGCRNVVEEETGLGSSRTRTGFVWVLKNPEFPDPRSALGIGPKYLEKIHELVRRIRYTPTPLHGSTTHPPTTHPIQPNGAALGDELRRRLGD